jgi:hypothetical protein
MKTPSIFRAACAAIVIATATPAAPQEMGQTVTPIFQQPITNIPGK